ncbi:MAG TPA: alpha/beta hydrolase, partial [Novosphingobium sp.]|nr:alpha/beta hydrolase [Novosphingobium sp.]
MKVVASRAAAQLWSGASQRGAAVRAELARRAALARQPQPAGVAAPPWRRMLGELGTGIESWRAWREAGASAFPATLTPRTVMLVPGFGTHPVRMRALRRGLAGAGHRVSDWGLGWNLGATPENIESLGERVLALAEREGEPVALVGWSLGGLFAREVARRTPHAVRLVVTMGSPFSGDLHAN